MKKGMFLFVVIFVLFPLIAGEGDITLQWTGEEDAAYIVEFKKDGIVLFRQRVEEPKISLDLAPGTYSYQISHLNKFEKISSQSEWYTLVVKKKYTPIISQVQEEPIYGEYKTQDLLIEAFNVTEGAEFTLERDGVALVLEYKKDLNNSYSVELDTTDLAPGAYDLRITNPSGRESLAEGLVILKPMLPPRVDGITPPQAYINMQLPHVILFGSDFDEAIEVFLKKGRERIHIPVNPGSTSTELDLWFNLNDLPDGEYDLILINPPEQKIVMKDFFAIVDPKKVRDQNYYNKIRWGTDLMVGFPLVDLFFDQGLTNLTFIDGEPLAPFPEVETVLRVDLDKDHPIFRYLGWETRMAFLPTFSDDYHFFTSSMGVYGKSHWDLPISLLTEFSLGYRTVGLVDNDFDGFFYGVGFSVIFSYDQYLLEANLRQDSWYISGQDWVDVQQISLRLGYRFSSFY